jgi:hypothetical protein
VQLDAKWAGSPFDFLAPTAVRVPSDFNKIVTQGLKLPLKPGISDPMSTSRYFNDGHGRRSTAMMLTKEEPQRIAANFLPELLAEAAKKMKPPTEAAYLNCTTVLSTC